MSKCTTGVDRWFDGSRGQGHIEAASGERVFVHYSAICGLEAPLPREGEQEVSLLEQTAWRLQATNSPD